MTTLVMPHGPTPSPDPVHTPSGPIRYVAVRANLLPDELVNSRRSGALNRRIVVALGAVLVLVLVLYGLSVWATHSAKQDLAKAQKQTTSLTSQQGKYDAVVAAQSKSKAIESALKALMVGDLPWKDMLSTLRSDAPNGIMVTSVNGTMTSGAASAGQTGTNVDPGLGLLNQSGKQEVGTLTIAGSAPDKNSVAAYVDALNKVKGLTAAFPQNVIPAGGKLTFSISVIITTDALGGRYSTQAVTAGGN